MNDDLPPQLQRRPSVLHLDKMFTVEYEEEARFFHQGLILEIASIAAMFHNSRKMSEPPNSSPWTLTPDGDVYPEMLLVPSATGSVWIDGKNKPILTTMMIAGHRLVRFYGFGVSEANLLSKGHCAGGTRGSGDAGYVRGGWDSSATWGLNTFSNAHYFAWLQCWKEPGCLSACGTSQCYGRCGTTSLDGLPVSNPRTLLSRGELKIERAPNPLFLHSSFGHLSGLLPKDLAVQEHALLCRISYISPWDKSFARVAHGRARTGGAGF